MRLRGDPSLKQRPLFIDEAFSIQHALAEYSVPQIQTLMHISEPLAVKTKTTIESWLSNTTPASPAIDSFIGDIYSGLRSDDFNNEDREYANSHLRILSGLYGILRPLDAIHPYRFEMGYRLPLAPHTSMYEFWGNRIAQSLPQNELIVHASSQEYIKVVEPYIDEKRIITPKFLTVHPAKQMPLFVAVHAKIARGAYARWIIKNRIESINDLPLFSDLGYQYDSTQSSPTKPVYIAVEFKGIGLSQRLKV